MTGSGIGSYRAPLSASASLPNPLDDDVYIRRRLAGMEATALEAALIAHAPDAIIFADCTGEIRLWNRGAETLFGYDAGEAVGHTLDLIVPEPSRTAHWAGFSRAVQRGHFAKDDVLLTSRALTKDGRVIVVELSAAIIRSPAGEVAGINGHWARHYGSTRPGASGS